ncbi:ORF6N domain-containing protein [Mucilaginibacter sp. SMC90]|uniref:ORF6N domain-containing protein n=1 Tax=Mucilaginibacter sp. SMC90 TaxID=2929803 RepID=UPI001FB5513A|nr:ORF6N domain-containing protein [Mucilaginibacter sp. SMC90]UOE49146.1 ORF6N domain-containing protein [Mucilaginibacter sp. SMC90]
MENQFIPDEIIMNKIYYIRGHKTMQASDLAELYNIETRVLNQSVNRNLKRFPPDFMFQLSENEYSFLTSQIVMSKKGRGGYYRLSLLSMVFLCFRVFLTATER